jgi:hypothetical protein
MRLPGLMPWEVISTRISGRPLVDRRLARSAAVAVGTVELIAAGWPTQEFRPKPSLAPFQWNGRYSTYSRLVASYVFGENVSSFAVGVAMSFSDRSVGPGTSGFHRQ